MLADRIDSVQLADLATRHTAQSDQLGPRRLPRLASLLAAGEGQGLDVGVRFAPDPSGLARLELAVNGEVQLVCQRCLAPMAWPVALEASLTVVASEQEAEGLEDPFEAIVMDPDGLCLDRIIEDEVLAAVPLAPRHEAGDGCRPAAPLTSAEQEQAGGVSRPFADLGALLKADQRRSN